MTEVKKRNISGSLTKKNIEISQLEIFPDALLQHGIPLLIKKGSVKNVTIKMPTKFKTDPITLNIESVTILCSVCTHDPIPEEIKNMKFHKLKAYQLFRKKYKMILGLLHKENVFSVVRTILSNLNMEINHIHIQIEYESKSKFDLTIPSFKYPQDYSKSSKYKPSQNSDDYAEYEEQESSINLSENSSNESANEEESLDEDSSDLNEEAIKMQRFSSYKKLIDNDQKEKENEKITSIGITISKMSLFNIGNSKETSNKKFTKDVKFSNFGMYMDVDESPVDLSTTENCEAELYNLFNSKKHNWILKQFSFNSTLKFEKDNPQIFFEPVIKQICINLKEEFIPIILNILKSVDVFLKKFAKALIPKPSFNDPNSLWIYCHKCAVSKISNPTFDFSKSLSLLEKRIIYIKNYKRKNIKSRNIIKNLEETLDYSNIVAFRCAYRLIHRKKRKSKKRSKITEKTTHKIIKEIRVDPVHSVTKLLEMFSLNFIGNLLNIVLTRNEQKHIEINIKNPHLLIEKDLKSVLIHIDISYLCAKLKDNVIINTIDNDQIKMKAEIIIPFHCYSNWLVSLDMSNNNYNLNMKYLLQVITDIKFIKLFLLEKNNLLMQSFRKKNFQFNIQIFSSVLKILGSKHYHAIQISFDKFLLLTDPKTFEKKFKFEKSILSFITENEAKISTDFSFTGSSIGKDLNLDIPFFSCVIPFKYYIVIEDFILLFMKHQVFFKDPAFPKIDINFVINMKGMDINITNLNSDQNITVQARQIMLSLKDSIFYYSLLSIIIQDLFQLSNSTFYYDKNSSNLKVSSIYIKVIELIELIPQNVFNLINNQNKILFDEDYNIIDNVSDSKNHAVIKKDDNFQFPNLKIEIDIDNIEVDFSITNTEHINLNLKKVKALFNNDKLKASALVDRIQFEDQLILFEPISCQLNVIVGKISKITIFLDKCNIIMNNILINNFSHLDFSTNKLKLSNEAQFKLIINMNQIIISNDLIIQKFHFEFFQNYSIINSLIKFESVKSSFLNSDSNCCIQIDGDIEQKTVDLNSDLTELTIYTIPFLEIFSRLPTIEIPIPQIKFNFIMKPLQCNLLIDDDYLNVIFNSQTKLKLDNLTKQIPSIILKTTDFLINLNNNELLNIQYFKFTMDKNITINVPSIIIKLTIFKIYKILKLLPIDHQIPITNLDMKPKILIKGISYESMFVQIPLIEIDIHKTNSKKCISFKFDNTELYLKYSNQKYILYASTNVLFDAFNGFLSYHLAEPFGIVSNGEFSETTKACTFEAQNPIKFEISSYVINQIIKNLSIKEDEMEQSYSMSNETGTKIIITIDNDTYEIESQAKIHNVPNFVGSDIIIKIGEISNPTKIYSSFSKIAYPFFFGNSFILLWMDVKRLQLRLLSPIIFKNTSNLDLKIEFLNREITLKNNEIHYLDYTINKLDSITVKLGEDQQKIQLNESSIIKLDNKFIVVTKKRKIETLQIKIKFKAPFCFRNELISDLTILLKDKQIILKPCEIVPFPYFSPSSEIISFDILDTKDIKGLHIDLLLNEIKEFFPTIDQNGNQFILQFTLSRKKWNNTISISPLLIFYSSLSIPLIFSLSKDEQIKKEKISENISKIFPYQNSQNVWMINNPTMISPFIVDIKNINIYISTKYSNQWSPNPLTMSDFDIIEDLMIPINDEIISFCHFHILSHNNIRPNTLIFFISPKYFINNQTEYTFSLNFIDGESIEISPNSIIPVTIIRNTLKFSMSVIDVNSSKKKNLVFSHKISIDKINSQFIKLKSIESPILLQLSTKKEIHFITILYNQTLPYLFVNNTQSKVIFVQKDTPDFAHVVMPNESLPFFIFDENMPTIIFCEIGNKIYFELDVNEPSFPVKIEIPENSNIQMNLYYYVDLSRKEGSTITLCNIIDNEICTNNNFSPNSSVNYRIFMGLANNREESSTNLNKTKPSQINNNVLNLSFNFNYISFLIITSQYQEMCRLTLKDVLIDSSIHDFSTRTQFSIGLIKIDDQNQYAIYPTVFQIFPVSNQPALKFFYTSFGSHKYGKIGIDIRPISVRIDLSFLSDFIGDIFYFHNHYKNKKLYDVQITEIIHNFMPKQTKYHINKISINPFKVHLSFNKISTRSNHPFQQEFQFNRLINFIPSFEHIAITIEESHFFRNLSGTPDEIFFNISHEIKKLILKRLYRKISTLGTRELMMMKNESKQELILNKTVSILTFAESTFTYISSIMDLYTGSPLSFRTDETSIGALSWGFSSLFSSVKNGFKQLISETKKRGKINGKNDYCGYLVGAGIGVSKCAAYCLSGFCNLNASLFSSVKRIFLTEKFIFLNERECEPSLGLHCSDNEKLLWYTGSVSSGLIEVYSKSIFILDENLFIQNIVRAEIKESRVIIFDEDENEFITTFENEKQANYFFSIVESHLLRKKIIELTDDKSLDDDD